MHYGGDKPLADEAAAAQLREHNRLSIQRLGTQALYAADMTEAEIRDVLAPAPGRFPYQACCVTDDLMGEPIRDQETADWLVVDEVERWF